MIFREMMVGVGDLRLFQHGIVGQSHQVSSDGPLNYPASN